MCNPFANTRRKMSTPRAELPGYLWDESKQRYFKIQPGHLTTSEHTQEAAENLRRQTEQQARKDRLINRSDTGQIKRNYNLNSVNFFLRPRTGDVGRKLFAQIAGAHELQTMGSWAAEARQHERLAAYTVYNGTVFTLVVEIRGTFAIYNSSISPPEIIYQHGLPVGGTTAISCGLIGDEVFGLVAYAGSTLHVMSPSRNWSGVPTRYQYPIGTRIHAIEISKSSNMIDSPVLVVATSIGMIIYRMGENGLVADDRILMVNDVAKEMMAVSFLGAHTVMSGERNGKVWLTDTRAAVSLVRLRHPRTNYGINGLSTTKRDNEIIVSGLKGSALYDIRFAKPLAFRHHSSSGTVVEYHHPYNLSGDKYGRGKALGYLKEFDIAAIRTSLVEQRQDVSLTFGQQLNFYHVPTGKLIPMPQHDQGDAGVLEGVQIARIRDGNESIFVNTPQRIYEFNNYWNGVSSFDGPYHPLMLNVNPYPGHAIISDIVQKYDYGNRGPAWVSRFDVNEETVKKPRFSLD